MRFIPLSRVTSGRQILKSSSIVHLFFMGRVMRKPGCCIHVCENKGATQLCGTYEADQLPCYHHISTS